jgi:hypothetical protein
MALLFVEDLDAGPRLKRTENAGPDSALSTRAPMPSTPGSSLTLRQTKVVSGGSSKWTVSGV